jgi:hypothetical protein
MSSLPISPVFGIFHGHRISVGGKMAPPASKNIEFLLLHLHLTMVSWHGQGAPALVL